MRRAAERFCFKPGDEIPGANVRILKQLGAGGHGTVYEVQHLLMDENDRYVVKVIHADLVGGKRGRTQIERETKLLAKLQHHPNVVRIIWAGWTGGEPSLFYFAMEKLSGLTLRQLLCHYSGRTRLPLEFVFYAAITLLRALAYAHENGIVHRDVKPENIFLHYGNDLAAPWVTKLLDFGIGTILSEGRRTTTNQTFAGTYAYAAPEQLLGEPTTSASDIYALGMILYESLTGERPFADRKNDVDLADAHINHAPPPLSSKRAVAPALESLVHRMLDKDPAIRLKSDEIERLLQEIRKQARRENPHEFSTGERPLWTTIASYVQAASTKPAFDLNAGVEPSRGAFVRVPEGSSATGSAAVLPADPTLPSHSAVPRIAGRRVTSDLGESLSDVDPVSIPLSARFGPSSQGRPSPDPKAPPSSARPEMAIRSPNSRARHSAGAADSSRTANKRTPDAPRTTGTPAIVNIGDSRLHGVPSGFSGKPFVILAGLIGAGAIAAAVVRSSAGTGGPLPASVVVAAAPSVMLARIPNQLSDASAPDSTEAPAFDR